MIPSLNPTSTICYKMTGGVFKDVAKNQASAIMERNPLRNLPITTMMDILTFSSQRKDQIFYIKTPEREHLLTFQMRQKLENSSEGNSSLFFDFDHDGDLDLFITRKGLKPALQE